MLAATGDTQRRVSGMVGPPTIKSAQLRAATGADRGKDQEIAGNATGLEFVTFTE